MEHLEVRASRRRSSPTSRSRSSCRTRSPGVRRDRLGHRRPRQVRREAPLRRRWSAGERRRRVASRPSRAFNPDYVSQQGLAAGGGGATPPVAGSSRCRRRSRSCACRSPSTSRWREDLSVEGGYRYSSYTVGFDTNTYKLGLEWAPSAGRSLPRQLPACRARPEHHRAVHAVDGGTRWVGGSVHRPALRPAHWRVRGQRRDEGRVRAPQWKSGLAVQRPARRQSRTWRPRSPIPTRWASCCSRACVPNLAFSVDYFDIKHQGRDRDLRRQHHHQRLRLLGAVLRPGAPRPGQRLAVAVTARLRDRHRHQRGSARRPAASTSRRTYRQPLPALGSLLFGSRPPTSNRWQTTPLAGGRLGYDCTGYYGDVCGGEGNPIVAGAERHLVDALGRARPDAPVALLRSDRLRNRRARARYLAGTPSSRRWRTSRPTATSTCRPRSMSTRTCGWSWVSTTSSTRTRRSSRLADCSTGSIGRRELQRQHLPRRLRRDGAVSVRPHHGAVLSCPATWLSAELKPAGCKARRFFWPRPQRSRRTR